MGIYRAVAAMRKKRNVFENLKEDMVLAENWVGNINKS